MFKHQTIKTICITTVITRDVKVKTVQHFVLVTDNIVVLTAASVPSFNDDKCLGVFSPTVGLTQDYCFSDKKKSLLLCPLYSQNENPLSHWVT